MLDNRKRMKNYLVLAFAALALAGCSSEELADVTPEREDNNVVVDETPILFNTHGANVTRTANPRSLESLGQYNFGVFAYKERGAGASAQHITIMRNYLVGYSNGTNGYDHSGSATWNASAGSTTDHKSPWFYDSLGSSDYKGGTGFYTKSNASMMSANAHQPLIYWDHAYDQTTFYAYTPYSNAKENGASFDYDNKILTAPYSDNFMFATKTVTKQASSGNAGYDNDVADLTFKHGNSQVRVAFTNSIKDYYVEILDLNGDNGSFADNTTDANKTGVVARAATVGTDGTNTVATYANGVGGTVTVDFSGATPEASVSGNSGTGSYLNFDVTPLNGLQATQTITSLDDAQISVTPVPDGSTYATSDPITVYPQQAPAFVFNVTFRLTNKYTGEQLTVHDAKVLVPAANTNWEVGKRYTYRFTITKDATGSTDPTKVINVDDVTVPSTGALHPIVFDSVKVDEYEDVTEDTYDFNINNAPANN